MVFNPQFSALSAYSSIGIGDYHAMQWTVRKRFSSGLLFDLNYTWSKSIDLGSTRKRDVREPHDGVVHRLHPEHLEPEPDARRVVLRHHASVNAYMVYQLPVRPRQEDSATNMNRVLDAFVGGWQISGTYRQTSRPAVQHRQRPALAHQLGSQRHRHAERPADSRRSSAPGTQRHRRTEPLAGSEGRFRGVPGDHGRPVRQPQYDARRRFLRHRQRRLQELHDAVVANTRS